MNKDLHKWRVHLDSKVELDILACARGSKEKVLCVGVSIDLPKGKAHLEPTGTQRKRSMFSKLVGGDSLPPGLEE